MWEHYTSLDWLKARCGALTATDVRDLLPETATGRPRKITDETRWKVLAGKLTLPSLDDTRSTGAAARGHMLEPYAIEERNKRGGCETLHHWDDLLVRKNPDGFGLGYSPDALNVVPPAGTVISARDLEAMASGPLRLGEVKCYNPEHHIEVGICQPKDKKVERWQIATAMAVSPTIQVGELILWQPRMVDEFEMLRVTWTREELAHEIEVVEGIETEFLSFLEHTPKDGLKPKLIDLFGVNGFIGALDERGCEEDEILAKVQECRLNP